MTIIEQIYIAVDNGVSLNIQDIKFIQKGISKARMFLNCDKPCI